MRGGIIDDDSKLVMGLDESLNKKGSPKNEAIS